MLKFIFNCKRILPMNTLPMKKAQQGFTLIELMIVVAIIGILAAIALPAYQSYMIKSKLVEATTLLDASKNAINESWANNGFPATADAPISITKPANAQYVNAIKYNSTGGNADGTTASVVVTLAGTGSTDIDGKWLGLFAVGHADGTVTWTCGTAASTDDETVAADTTMYPYLPANCQH
jgi:type IV pilus assembly protein PilA